MPRASLVVIVCAATINLSTRTPRSFEPSTLNPGPSTLNTQVRLNGADSLREGRIRNTETVLIDASGLLWGWGLGVGGWGCWTWVRRLVRGVGCLFSTVKRSLFDLSKGALWARASACAMASHDPNPQPRTSEPPNPRTPETDQVL